MLITQLSASGAVWLGLGQEVTGSGLATAGSIPPLPTPCIPAHCCRGQAPLVLRGSTVVPSWSQGRCQWSPLRASPSECWWSSLLLDQWTGTPSQSPASGASRVRTPDLRHQRLRSRHRASPTGGTLAAARLHRGASRQLRAPNNMTHVGPTTVSLGCLQLRRVQNRPVGLFGEQRMTTLVFSLTNSRNFCASNRKPVSSCS